MKSKVLVIFITIALIISNIPCCAFAADLSLADVNNDGKFFYFALGDSITTGMGTSDSFTEGRDVRDIAINHKDCPKTSYPYLIANEIFKSVDSKEKSFSNWGIPGYRTEEYYSMITGKTYINGSEYWKIYEPYHEQIISELKEADFITISIGSNDLLQSFIYDLIFASFDLSEEYIASGHTWADVNIDNFPNVVGSVRNPLLINIAYMLMGTLIGNENARTGFYNLINTAIDNAGGIKETNVLDNIFDLIVLLDSDNLLRSFEKSSKEAADYYTQIVKYIKENLNSKAEIALINCFAPYGNSFEANIIVDAVNNPAETKKQGYTAPEVLKRIITNTSKYSYGLLKEKPDYKSFFGGLGGGDGNSTFGDLKTQLKGLNLDAAKEEFAKYAEKFSPILDLYEIPSWLQDTTIWSLLKEVKDILSGNTGSIFDWISLILTLINPLTHIGTIASLIFHTTETKDFILHQIENELTYPVRYMLFGKIIAEGISYFNTKLEQISKDFGCLYVDVYDMPASAEPANSPYSSWNPHPSDAGHIYIYQQVISSLSKL